MNIFQYFLMSIEIVTSENFFFNLDIFFTLIEAHNHDREFEGVQIKDFRRIYQASLEYQVFKIVPNPHNKGIMWGGVKRILMIHSTEF